MQVGDRAGANKPGVKGSMGMDDIELDDDDDDVSKRAGCTKTS